MSRERQASKGNENSSQAPSGHAQQPDAIRGASEAAQQLTTAGFSNSGLIQLQRTIGNRAVQRMLQRKTSGPVTHPAERTIQRANEQEALAEPAPTLGTKLRNPPYSLSEGDAGVFESLSGSGWSEGKIEALALLFVTDNGGKAAALWGAIAVHLADRDADAAALARIVGWQPIHLAALAALLKVDAGVRGIADWTAIAKQLIDKEAEVAAFAALKNWKIANLEQLALSFNTDNLGITTKEWVPIAELLTDREADVVTLLGLYKVDNYKDSATVAALAKCMTDHKVPAADIVHLAKNVAGLLPAALIPLLELWTIANYDKRTVMEELGGKIVAGSPVARIVEVVKGENGLKPPDLKLLLDIFARYPKDADLILLAKAVVTGFAGGRGAAELVDFVNRFHTITTVSPEASETGPLLSAGAMAAYSITELSVMYGHLRETKAAEAIQVAGWLAPLAAAAVNGLLSPLRTDGMNGGQMHQLVQSMNGKGLNGTQIAAKVTALRGSLGTGGTSVQDITTTVGGGRILTGGMILDQATAGGVLERYPISGINPSGRNENDLWQDCDLAVTRDPGETAAHKTIRQRMALSQIMKIGGVNPAIVQQVFLANGGATPRAVLGPAGEDGLSGGHIDDRHVTGTGGMIDTINDVAARAITNNPICGVRAGAFAGTAAATSAMQDAVTNYVATSTNWEAMRSDIIRGVTHEFDIAVGGVAGDIMKRVGAPKAWNALPFYYNGGIGDKIMFPGDPLAIPPDVVEHPAASGKYWIRDAAWKWYKFNNVNPSATHNNAPSKVHLRILGRNCTGGWAIHSAWPLP